MARVPSATYRMQLHKGFTFDHAAAQAEYLWRLGISHVYSSPYLQAAPGSMHGYDVVDHQALNAELGGAEAHERFCKKLGENGLGQVLDIVPNHMALGRENRFWWDVLENGSSSRYASFFDIDWQPQEERLRNKVLVPVLGDQYGRVLEQGGITLTRAGGVFQVECAGQSLPVAPTSLPAVLSRAADYAKSDTLSFLSASFGRLPTPELSDLPTLRARHRDKMVLLGMLEGLCADEAGVCEALDRAIEDTNKNLDALDDFLSQQNYRLAYWKTADQQLGYRRFFDVNTLIGLRMEREHVFEETHALVLDWLRRGVLDGVRIDHPDGLRDPLQYFERLRKAAPDAWIIGEKILEPGEFLRENWPIDGTSGYDFMNVVGGLLVDPSGLRELGKFYGEFTAQPVDFADLAYEKKIGVQQEALGSDVNRLTSLFVEICESNRNHRDHTRAEVRRAIREVAACFSIYRTYVVPSREEITDEDRGYINEAVRSAKSRRSDIDEALFDFLGDVLSMRVTGRQESEFVLRFQQFSSPVMAKGVEDTAFYCFDRLTSLCEVGGDPGRDGLSLAEFHEYQTKMQATHPRTMTTLSTHDTKRSDDVRARLAVLTEVPSEFSEAVVRWSRLNAAFRVGVYPDRNTEYFYYQTLIGAWPIDADRAKAYMLKAMREAKQQTTWVANNKPYEDALNTFIEATLANVEFTTDVKNFVQRITESGRINSLSQTLLKCTVPGVPDLYQGSELWDLSLVDPDNRRPVDYREREKLLGELTAMSAAEVLARMEEGMPKLWTLWKALSLRREHPEWFDESAAYTPLTVTGAKGEHVAGFRRGDSVVVVTPRLPHVLAGVWGGTAIMLPSGRWRNRLTDEGYTGEIVLLKDLLKVFPVALLTREDA